MSLTQKSFIKRNSFKLLFLIFVLVCFVKLYYAYGQDSLSHNMYFEKRQIESIKSTGIPIGWDELSYSGRQFVSEPIYYYLLAFASIFLGNDFAIMFLPALFLGLLSIVIFFIVKRNSGSDSAALVAALFTGFVPILVTTDYNLGGVYMFAFFMLFLTLYLFISIRRKNNLKLFIGLIFLLPFIQPITVLILPGLLVYLLLIRLEGLPIKKIEIEAILFTIFFTALALFWRYKQALILNGARIVWQNVPISILNQYFVGVNIITYIVAVSMLPLLIGIYALYEYTFNVVKPSVHVFIGLMISTVVLLWFKIVRPEIGLALVSINLIILTGEGIKLINNYLDDTKFRSLKQLAWAILLILFLFTSVSDTINAYSSNDNFVNEELMDTLNWVEVNTPIDSVILGKLEFGHLITSIARRRNVFDDNFILVEDVNNINNDVNTIFDSKSLIKTTKLLNKYNVNYLLLDYIHSDDNFAKNSCFELEFKNDEYALYRILCKVEAIN